jgi:hypothetical protein
MTASPLWATRLLRDLSSFSQASSSRFVRAIYTIVALLPVEADGRPRYRIKSREENFERVLTEELLGRKN